MSKKLYSCRWYFDFEQQSFTWIKPNKQCLIKAHLIDLAKKSGSSQVKRRRKLLFALSLCRFSCALSTGFGCKFFACHQIWYVFVRLLYVITLFLAIDYIVLSEVHENPFASRRRRKKKQPHHKVAANISAENGDRPKSISKANKSTKRKLSKMLVSDVSCHCHSEKRKNSLTFRFLWCCWKRELKREKTKQTVKPKKNFQMRIQNYTVLKNVSWWKQQNEHSEMGWIDDDKKGCNDWSA